MAQVIPPITSLPIDSSAAPSVEDIQDRLPSICVDYLSYEWKEEDVYRSWRNMTRHKNDIANGVRLENASWRTWQKQRNKLKTISPETLNCALIVHSPAPVQLSEPSIRDRVITLPVLTPRLKDSDVTWLYGPLHTADVEPVRPLRIAAADERLGIELPAGKKPILKHRTLSEMLAIAVPTSPILEAFHDQDDVDSSDGMENLLRPVLHQTKSDTNIFRQRGLRRSPTRRPIIDRSGEDFNPAPPDSAHHSGGKKHISFNTFVEQCVAVDDPAEIPVQALQHQQQQELEQHQSQAHHLQRSDSDDDMLEMRSASSSRTPRPSLSRTSSSTSAEHVTIAKIAPTMLKMSGNFGRNSPAVVYMPPPEYRSPSQQSAPPYDFASPEDDVHAEWADDLQSGAYDYFHGISPESRSPPYTSPRGTPVNVGAPPAQPKWRQAAAIGPQSSEMIGGSSASSSSSSISQVVQGAQSPRPVPGPASQSLQGSPAVGPYGSPNPQSGSGVISPPQPARGILKVRQSVPTTPTPEPSSPPSTFFNYNPSVATGLGSMRAPGNGGTLYDREQTVNGVVPPAQPHQHQHHHSHAHNHVNHSPVEDQRGRSTSRDRPTSAIGRSSSGSQSIGSTSSLSPGTPRSPTDPPILPSVPPPGKKGAPEPSGIPSGLQGAQHGVPVSATPGDIPSTPVVRNDVDPVLRKDRGNGAVRMDSVQEDEKMDVDYSSADGGEDRSEEEKTRNTTPTPHSSPQIAFRPMKDTSPASLPHVSSKILPSQNSHSSTSQTPSKPHHHQSPSSQISLPPTPDTRNPVQAEHPETTEVETPKHALQLNTDTSVQNEIPPHDQGQLTPTSPDDLDLPRADPATFLPSPSPRGRATIARVPTHAQPTLTQPRGRSVSSSQPDGRSVSSSSRASWASGISAVSAASGASWTSVGSGASGGSQSGLPRSSVYLPDGETSASDDMLESGKISNEQTCDGVGSGESGDETPRPIGSFTGKTGVIVGQSQAQVEEETIYGRAATMANTAKDLLGALWYGGEDGRAQRWGDLVEWEKDTRMGRPWPASVLERR
ncbi:hypothetical protein M231_03745 [Tremella mesenterica]|uniref:Nitrogen regulatory protein areA GATA-like domain-containing protein n=1 Tax=Tremella mesenterica TaxID=5217 RepID=A0A4Q1BMF6_TREME|nr:hypothetical protein M231_03745 [Tremella mesenterica]